MLDAKGFRQRDVLGAIILAPATILLLFSRPLIDETYAVNIIIDLTGWLFFLLYVTLRIWATIFIGGRKDNILQTEGPYSITRNPLYLGSFCFALSEAFFLESVTLILLIFIGAALYSRIVVRAEEEFLGNKFGDAYRAYCSVTPRIWPRFSLYRSPESINLNLSGVRNETRRLWTAFLMPIAAEIIMHLRMVNWWPHYLVLP